MAHSRADHRGSEVCGQVPIGAHRRLEATIGNQVRPGASNQAYVVNIDITGGAEVNVEFGGRGGDVGRHEHPLRRRITLRCRVRHRRPIARSPIVLVWVYQLERAAVSAGGRRPGGRAAISHLGHDEVVRAVPPRLNQGENLAMGLQGPRKGIERREIASVGGGVSRRVGRQDQETMGSDSRAGREGVGEAVELPSGQVEGDSCSICCRVRRIRPLATCGLIHDLVNHNLANRQQGLRR